MALEQDGPKTIPQIQGAFPPEYAMNEAARPLRRKFPLVRQALDAENNVHRYTISSGKIYFQHLFYARGSDLL